MREEVARRARREVVRAAHEGLDWGAMSERMATAIGRAVPFDFHCWHTMDPATLIFTGAAAWDVPGVAHPHTDGCDVLAHVEYAIPDVIQWSYLARSLWPVGILSRATHGNPRLSARYRELMHPHGHEHELRASFVSDGSCWGAAGLYRIAGRPDFDEREADFLASLDSVIADGFRRALLVTAPLPEDVPDGPGLIVLDHRDEVESVTTAALRWMEEIVDPGRPQAHPPLVVRAVAARARRAGDENRGGKESSRARTYTQSGRWLIVHGMRMTGGDEGRIAVIIEPGRPDEIAPLILRAYGLSDRERQVTRLVMVGAATDEIARVLNISPHTVQDHLKAIFEKTGIRSRRELVAKVFFDHYWPSIARNETPDPSGRFTAEATLASG